ncbi:uncharacterized protein LOC119833006 [Zerene cesonia]|uniref:uncharacterized protein LOC119833006 n=1 Tax=Zerene cesonia TaxID=33412 RepID=UPI0018E554BD|nr:uncharacterized protein LOC119833006 [Zerene cesonia]
MVTDISPSNIDEHTAHTNLVLFIIGVVSQVVEIIFVILLIVGIHKQRIAIVRITYVYNVLMLGVEILVAVVYIPLQSYRLYVYDQDNVWFSLIALMSLALLFILMQLYTVVLVRSQICSMRKQCVSDPKRSEYCNTKPYVVY